GPGAAEIIAPGHERLGIILSENALADDRHAEALAERLQDLRRGQHAAGKHVTLDEVDLAPVGFEAAVADGDGLDAGKSARQQPVTQLRKILRPELLADRLDHLDRGDAVVALALVAIILQPDLDLVAEAGLLDTLLREVPLLPADGETDDLRAEGPCDIFGKPAPAAADLEQTLARLQIDRLGEPAIFVVLCRGEIGRAVLEQRGRIGHARIEPCRVERVADVVMGKDVAARLAARVAVEPVAYDLQKAQQRLVA